MGGFMYMCVVCYRKKLAETPTLQGWCYNECSFVLQPIPNKTKSNTAFCCFFFFTYDSIDMAWTVERQPWIIYEEWIQLDWIALRFLVTFLPLLFFVLCQLRQFEWRFNDFFDNDDYFFLFFFSLLFLHTLIQSTLSFFSQSQSIQLFFFCNCINYLSMYFTSDAF